MRRTGRIEIATTLGIALLCCAAAGGCAANAKISSQASPASYDGQLPDAWYAVWSPLGELPLIEFHFAPPQDIYVGEVHRASGVLRFGKGLTFERARGKFSIYIHAIEMGEDDLTLNVQNAIDMLDRRRFPKIYYDIRSVSSNAENLSFGVATPIVLHGLFKLKGVTFPLDVNAVVLPTVDEGGEPIMMLTGSFTLRNLKSRFDITGPGDPDNEAGDTVTINFRFPLVPEQRSKAIRAKELSERKPYSEPEVEGGQ